MLPSLYFVSIFLTLSFFFFFNDPATTEIYTLSLHDALPISPLLAALSPATKTSAARKKSPSLPTARGAISRSEEHTSELQSHSDLVCRLLLEKKKQKYIINIRNALTQFNKLSREPL